MSEFKFEVGLILCNGFDEGKYEWRVEVNVKDKLNAKELSDLIMALSIIESDLPERNRLLNYDLNSTKTKRLDSSKPNESAVPRSIKISRIGCE